MKKLFTLEFALHCLILVLFINLTISLAILIEQVMVESTLRNIICFIVGMACGYLYITFSNWYFGKNKDNE